MIHLNEFQHIIPLLIIAGAAVITLLLEMIFKKSENIILGFSIVSVIAAILFSFTYLNKEFVIFNEFLRINNSSIVFSVIILIGILITLFASKAYLEKEEINFGEYYSLLLFAVTGMLLMVFANDLLIIFIGLELMSICFYVLAGFLRNRVKSNESAMKYFLLGAFMTGFLLYGIALIYGATGTTNITRILANPKVFSSTIFMVGMGLFLIGFFFKMGIFPFHMWIPDVYDGAPTVVSGMMSTAGKIAAVGTIVPLILYFNLIDFRILFAIAAVVTMLFGNIIALAQTNIKRLLAYSSIASAGYVMVGVASLNDFALKGITYYLIAYTFMQLGAFIVVSIIESSSDDKKDFKFINLADYKGLAKRNLLLATFLSVFLFSLAGIPPFAGFWGKYYLFYAAIKANLVWLAVIGILLSVVSVYYYIRIIVYMWFQDAPDELLDEKVIVSSLGAAAVWVAIVGTLVFGVYPQLFFTMFKFVIN
ncbi:MAG: NADH-quinone oxidoreductase subunit N [Ignavibacteria bacterium]|nr:NADH-quinone oxidoreductase subunit N [Ignavibacteria bacterium]